MKHFQERYDESLFVKTVTLPVEEIYRYQFSKWQKKEIEFADFNTYGTTKEVQLKSIFLALEDIKTYLSDLQKLPKFFNVGSEEIKLAYKNEITTSEYFKYQYDNFVIRVMTSIDLCGKIGCKVYDIKTDKVFYDKFTKCKKTIDSIALEKIKDFKNHLKILDIHRNFKIHEGKSLESIYDKVVYWEEDMNLIGAEMDKEDMKNLNMLTNNDLLIKIEYIQNVIDKVIDSIFDFLESLTEKTAEIVNSKI